MALSDYRAETRRAAELRTSSRLKRLPLALCIAACAWAAPNAYAGPGELTVVTVGPMKDALADAIAKYKAETGETVAVIEAGRSQLKAKVHGAEHPDLVIASQEELDGLEKGGQTQAATRAPLGRAGLAVALREGVKAPDLSSAEALKQVLSSAKSLSYADPDENPAGAQAGEVVEKLGLTAAVKPKLQLGSGSNPVSAVGFGDVEVGLYPTPLILSAKGAQVAAPLPADLQKWTRYDGALISEAPNATEAKRLLGYLSGAGAKAAFAARGFEAAQ